MNKKGQMIILKIMLAILVLIMAVAWSTPIKESVGTAMNTSSYLNCSSTSLDAATNATCVVLDFSIFYFLGAVISVGMAFIAGKKNGFGVITGIVTFVLIAVLINPLKEFIIMIRDTNHLSCGAVGNSLATNITCIFMDLWLFWFVVIVVSALFSYIFIKEVVKSEN